MTRAQAAATRRHEAIPADFPVKVVRPGTKGENIATDGYCGLSWDDGIVTDWTPTPSARCPFEPFHVYPEERRRRRGPITVQSVRYNRNGISGDGFYVVAFTMADKPLLAAVFPDGDGPLCAGRDIHGAPMLARDLLRCAIVDPAEPQNMHTGEGFLGWLAEAIDRWAEDGRAFRGRGE